MSSTARDPVTHQTDDSYPRLLGDVGGTNARLALQLSPGGEPEHVRFLPTAAFPGPQGAIEQYLREVEGEVGHAVTPRWACLGVACPVEGDIVSMTNQSWTFSLSELQDSLGLSQLLCLNDFTALAWSLPAMKPDDLRQVGGERPQPGRAKALLGAGTGLGVSGLVPFTDGEGKTRWVPLQGEGGHVTLAARDAREARVLEALRERWEHVSAERVLSGMGIEALYSALLLIGGREQAGGVPSSLSAEEVVGRAIAGRCPVCAEALELFCAFFGTVAGDLALTLGSLGGVYVGGGIVPKLGVYFHRSRFRARFEDKGRYRDYLGRIPVYVIHDGQAALRGAAAALEARTAPGSTGETEAARPQ